MFKTLKNLGQLPIFLDGSNLPSVEIGNCPGFLALALEFLGGAVARFGFCQLSVRFREVRIR